MIVDRTCKRSSSVVAASVEGSGTEEEEAVLFGNRLRCHPQYFMMMPCNVISVYVLIDPFSKRSGRIPASSVQPTLFSLLMSGGGRQAQTSNCLCQSDRRPCPGNGGSGAEVCAQLSFSPWVRLVARLCPQTSLRFALARMCHVTGVQTVPVEHRRARSCLLSCCPAARRRGRVANVPSRPFCTVLPLPVGERQSGICLI